MTIRVSADATAKSVDHPLEAALALRAAGSPAKALDVLAEVTDYSADAFTLRGELQMELGQFHLALGTFSTVVAFDRHNTYALDRLATCLCRLERWEEAADAYRRILEQVSYSDHARVGLGDCLLHLRRPEDALPYFEACWSEWSRIPSVFGKAVAL